MDFPETSHPDASAASPLPPIEQPTWSLAEALLVGLCFFGAIVAAGYLARALPLEKLVGKVAAPFVLLPLMDALICIVIWRLAAVRGRRALALGISPERLGRKLLFAVVVFVLSFPAVWLLVRLNELVVSQLGIPIKEHPLLLALARRPSDVVVVFLVIYAVLVRPAVEELYFRAFLYPPLRRTLGAGSAIAANGLLFAVPHFQPQAILPLAALGMLLAFIYERTRSLPAVVLVHVLNNALTISLVFIFAYGAAPQAG